MNCIEMIRILSKQWANVDDIQKIASCGRDKASKIRDNISLDIYSNGKRLPIAKYKVVPMKSVIEYLDIDVDYIYSMAEKEKNIK